MFKLLKKWRKRRITYRVTLEFLSNPKSETMWKDESIIAINSLVENIMGKN